MDIQLLTPVYAIIKLNAPPPPKPPVEAPVEPAVDGEDPVAPSEPKKAGNYHPFPRQLLQRRDCLPIASEGYLGHGTPEPYRVFPRQAPRILSGTIVADPRLASGTRVIFADFAIYEIEDMPDHVAIPVDAVIGVVKE